MKVFSVLLVVLSGGLMSMLSSSSAARTPVELGRIPWQRDFEAAREKSVKSGKPLLVLFDEVPGCVTCQRFGTGPLSHPIAVDAATELFVPVVVYNNVEGADSAVLKRFKEPAWNNPVVRFFAPDGHELLPRETGDYATAGLLRRMSAALVESNIAVPEFLQLATFELNPAGRQTATYAMGCYWKGEIALGKVDGVIAVQTGMQNGEEVTQVEYDPQRVDRVTLDTAAASITCPLGPRPPRPGDLDSTNTQQHSLWLRPEWQLLPLTHLQAVRANSEMGLPGGPVHLLSPSQVALLKQLRELDADKLRDLRDQLEPDRTPDGISTYARRLGEALR